MSHPIPILALARRSDVLEGTDDTTCTQPEKLYDELPAPIPGRPPLDEDEFYDVITGLMFAAQNGVIDVPQA